MPDRDTVITITTHCFFFKQQKKKNGERPELILCQETITMLSKQ